LPLAARDALTDLRADGNQGLIQASGSRTYRFARLGKMGLAARQLRLLETGQLGIARTATHFPDNRRVFFTQGPVSGFAAPDGDRLSLDARTATIWSASSNHDARM
jgi:hypothetical protein